MKLMEDKKTKLLMTW